MRKQLSHPHNQQIADASVGGSRGVARLHAIAAAALLCTGLASLQEAHALALGRVTVRSALGEPLKAEIAVPQISAEEADSIKVRIAPPSAFQAKGMDFNPALGIATVVLQRSASGESVLSITSSRTVSEPFMDVVIQANWKGGELIRDYTLLFDPPVVKKPAPEPVPAAAVAPKAATKPATKVPAVEARPIAPAPATATGDSKQVKVNAGDTAGKIAAANLPANVSLDQMLVAMLRANPDAFIGNNVNRLKAGAVLDIPTAVDAEETSPGEARRMIVSQSRDFNAFRSRLAESVKDAGVAKADREASGKIETEVQDKKPTAQAEDKLELSKGSVGANGKPTAEDKIAEERRTKEAADRAAELNRNISDLSKVAQAQAPAPATPAASAPATTAPAAAPAPQTTDASPAAVTTPAATPAAPEPATPAAAPAEAEAKPADVVAEPPAPAPAPKPKAPPKPAPKPAPEPETSLMDDIMGSPWLLPVGGLVVALLGGLAFFRLRQGKKEAPVDSSFLESRLQPDSFFGASGGQRIDTQDAQASGSSMVYSPSQLDAAGDVDPVAEADVYLAYGRDLQAEEILKEALRSAPTRVAIHTKLLEVYAKRRDTRAFEVLATETYGLTQGQGSDWEAVCDMGKELDPSNQLYQPGGAPVGAAPVEAREPGGMINTMPFTSSTQQDTEGGLDSANAGLDLDLDLDLDTPAAGEPSAGMPLHEDPIVSARGEPSAIADLGLTEALTSEPAESRVSAPAPMDFDLDFPSTPGSLEAMETPAPSSAPSSDMMALDLSDINLDIDESASTVAPSSQDADSLTQENPLETKLSLAEEFRAIGDMEGARSLAEEVLAEAEGALKSKANAFLADLT